MSLFITIEGGEGSGKTSVSKEIVSLLNKSGIKAIYTREPGGSKIAEEIRDIILKKDNTVLDSKTEVLLFASSRRQHLIEVIKPALNRGIVVISDRFIDSSLAYQGYARNININEIYEINRFALDDIMPDLTILFDVDPDVGLSRINKDKSREINRLDIEKYEFHQKVANGYRELAKKYPRIKTVNANKNYDEVLKDAYDIILKELNARK